MGTDNLFRKRKAKKVRELARRRARRAPYAKVLIVCEGEKTEPHYFKELKDYYALNSANVVICDNCCSDPLKIFHYAEQRYQDEDKAGDPFDRVFCVFDRDEHATYQQTINRITQEKHKGIFSCINSVPCFEYWLLLHFKYTTKPYKSLPENSACSQVLAELKMHMPNYTKGNNDIFQRLINQLEFAKKNATRVLQYAQKNHIDNPKTHVHELVLFMQNIKQKKKY